MRAFIFSFFMFLGLLGTSQAAKIGVIVPMQHKAMDEIVEGLKEVLEPYLSDSDEIVVQNANGEQTLQYQIIKSMLASGVDYFLPIGTATSLMTLSVVKEKPVICIAAMIDSKDLKRGNRNQKVAVIRDEISVEHLLRFIHTAFPQIKSLGLLYGNSEKVFPEVARAKELCIELGLPLKAQKVDTMSEVYQTAPALFQKADAVMVLKDHSVVSAMTAIAALAQKQKKLVIAMDNGSVGAGAHFALGVPEREIGRVSGTVLALALQGKDAEAFQEKNLENLFLFFNPLTLETQSFVSLDQLKEASVNAGYTFEAVKCTLG
jgi:putative tryptophan/tyrosine transport system substrate-binding protein